MDSLSEPCFRSSSSGIPASAAAAAGSFISLPDRLRRSDSSPESSSSSLNGRIKHLDLTLVGTSGSPPSSDSSRGSPKENFLQKLSPKKLFRKLSPKEKFEKAFTEALREHYREQRVSFPLYQSVAEFVSKKINAFLEEGLFLTNMRATELMEHATPFTQSVSKEVRDHILSSHELIRETLGEVQQFSQRFIEAKNDTTEWVNQWPETIRKLQLAAGESSESFLASYHRAVEDKKNSELLHYLLEMGSWDEATLKKILLSEYILRGAASELFMKRHPWHKVPDKFLPTLADINESYFGTKEISSNDPTQQMELTTCFQRLTVNGKQLSFNDIRGTQFEVQCAFFNALFCAFNVGAKVETAKYWVMRVDKSIPDYFKELMLPSSDAFWHLNLFARYPDFNSEGPLRFKEMRKECEWILEDDNVFIITLKKWIALFSKEEPTRILAELGLDLTFKTQKFGHATKDESHQFTLSDFILMPNTSLAELIKLADALQWE